MSGTAPSALDEILAARRVVDANECAMRGHSWQLVEAFGYRYPTLLFCSRDCGTPPVDLIPLLAEREKDSSSAGEAS